MKAAHFDNVRVISNNCLIKSCVNKWAHLFGPNSCKIWILCILTITNIYIYQVTFFLFKKFLYAKKKAGLVFKKHIMTFYYHGFFRVRGIHSCWTSLGRGMKTNHRAPSPSAQSLGTSSHTAPCLCLEADIKINDPDKMDPILKNVQFL